METFSPCRHSLSLYERDFSMICLLRPGKPVRIGDANICNHLRGRLMTACKGFLREFFTEFDRKSSVGVALLVEKIVFVVLVVAACMSSIRNRVA